MATPWTAPWARARVVDALRLLAQSADEQVALLPGFVEVPDELAQTFDEAYRLITERGLAGAFEAEQLSALAEIDRVLDQMSRPPAGELAWTPELLARSAWTLDGLHTDLRWAGLRRRAQRLLRSMGEDFGRPMFPGAGLLRHTPPAAEEA